MANCKEGSTIKLTKSTDLGPVQGPVCTYTQTQVSNLQTEVNSIVNGMADSHCQGGYCPTGESCKPSGISRDYNITTSREEFDGVTHCVLNCEVIYKFECVCLRPLG